MKIDKEAFQAFHKNNPHVWDMFVRFSLEAAKSGRKHFSVRAVWERIRWETSIATTDAEFKLNNNYQAQYGRAFMQAYPHLGEFFRTRESKQ